jgi:hypothetical protein
MEVCHGMQDNFIIRYSKQPFWLLFFPVLSSLIAYNFRQYQGNYAVLKSTIDVEINKVFIIFFKDFVIFMMVVSCILVFIINFQIDFTLYNSCAAICGWFCRNLQKSARKDQTI